MLRIRHLIAVISLGLIPLGCSPMGCSGEDPEQDKPAQEQFEGAVEEPLPAATAGTQTIFGTWENSGDTGVFHPLVLMTDGRFHYTKKIVCAKAPCEPADREGTYKLYGREGRHYIVMTGRAVDNERYEYSLVRNTLQLRPLVQGSEWSTLTSSKVAWCGTEKDCSVQGLAAAECAGKYDCGKNACSWTCATAPVGSEQPAEAGQAVTATCPTAAECIIANSKCTEAPRDGRACAAVEGCRKCFPNGWDMKNVPETRDPNPNPVLKQ